MPASFDDFSTGFDNFGSFGQSASTLMGEPKLRLRSPRSKTELIPDAPQRRKQVGHQAFGHRYDFNSSLSAAKSNAYAALGELSGLSLRAPTKQSSHDVPATTPAQSVPNVAAKRENGVNGVKSHANHATFLTSSKPAALVSEKPSLTSQSYQELVDKYCCVGAQGKSEEVKTH